MPTLHDVSVELAYMTCGQCGIAFALPETMRSEKERSGGNWFCPNGHSRVYMKTREQKLQEELAAEMRRRSAAEEKQREAEAKLVKVEKRIAKGVCPCCQRTFINMQRHIKSKHPEFGLIASAQ